MKTQWIQRSTNPFDEIQWVSKGAKYYRFPAIAQTDSDIRCRVIRTAELDEAFQSKDFSKFDRIAKNGYHDRSVYYEKDPLANY